jgi:hypothetical protein
MNTVAEGVAIGIASSALETSIRSHWPRYGSVRVGYSMIKISMLTTVIPRIAPRRLEKATAVLLDLAARGSDPYAPLVYADDQGVRRIAFGPLVENNSGRLLLLDGVHRSLAAHNSGIDAIYVAVIEPQNYIPAPGTMRSLLEVETADTEAARLPPFEGKISVDFRPSALFTSSAEEELFRDAVRR